MREVRDFWHPESQVRKAVAIAACCVVAPFLGLLVLLLAIPAFIGFVIETWRGDSSQWWNHGVHQGRYKRDD